ncbi:hypothetical protein SPRG_10443 [Saprolegnia parasitica CBS 223.65]|uniref:Uncharacterized protein n=1 Tax=Saprolegnia parasitica (strain CBS 223.65) TaxID=695850 RepID=A0A067CCV0_SAPPC|nr:hypothetical protein SPRG_10443 [Saprolegnia parasitica CBS 223.65]KDO24366.1 hypothetical protein SPRG_10443 [Saprolegnia parasitica CBS 223.65]|eukprot:XP_012204959.1 hypothetical protein SPRG_10443 [Saprolegnia parasitica CBS 223.65]
MTNWFNDRLQVVTNLSDASPSLDNAVFYSNDNLYNTSATASNVPILYANMIQDEINSLVPVIDSLRSMDGCALPWIATSYCFVDWGRTWSLAASSDREAACARQSQNAAIYLESVLRNAEWTSLSLCWGDALNSSVFVPLQSSRAGQQWTSALHAANLAPRSSEDEAVTWRRAGLLTFTTLWQNYKALGVMESFEIHNAFGLAYALKLKSSNATLQLGTQTSYKMFTPLAFSLSLVRNNATALGGRSLIKGTPTFAYTNVSATDVLMQNGSLPNPLGLGLALFHSSIGPFGEVDLRRLPCPDVVKQWYETSHASLTLVVTAHDAALHAFEVLQSPNQYTPSPWPNATDYYGGNLLCDTQTSSDASVLTFFTLGGSCMAHMNDLLGVSTMSATMAVAAMGSALTASAMDDIDGIAVDGGKTLELLHGILTYLDAHVPSVNRTRLAALAAGVRAEMETNYPVALAQYISFNVSLGAGVYGSGPPLLAQGRLFDTISSSYEYFAWLYLIEWVHGVREVVVFESSVGRITTFSGRNAIARVPVNGMEIPANVATYFQRVVQYITIVLGLVTLMASIYIVTAGGYIEASNLLVVNRVGGLVWIGRPLLFLRSMTAICLLSTSGLQLMQMAGYFRFESVRAPWYTTITASGELTWLAFILNDAFSLLTQQYTSGYSSKSAIVVWVASAIWSFASPITHHVQIERRCVVVAVDAQAICHGGHVKIGSVQRFLALNLLVCGIVLVLYVVERLRFPQLARPQGSSFFLYAAANYQFKKARWQHRDVYCIDKASAVINGLLSFEWGDRVFMLDIKTWRKHIVAIGKERREIRDDPSLQHLAHTIPMKH